MSGIAFDRRLDCVRRAFGHRQERGRFQRPDEGGERDTLGERRVASKADGRGSPGGGTALRSPVDPPVFSVTSRGDGAAWGIPRTRNWPCQYQRRMSPMTVDVLTAS